MKKDGRSSGFSHKDDVRIIDKQYCHEGFLRVPRYLLQYKRYDGSWSAVVTREVLERAPGVGVLLYDPETDKVLLVEQFRVGCLDNPDGPWVLELVAGIIDDEAETPREVAIREAREEADQTISQLLRVCEYYNSPGGSSERIHVFCARADLSDPAAIEGIFGLDAEEEDIRTLVLDREEANDLMRRGRINNAMAVIALQWLTLHRQYVDACFRAA